jgi:hypothetical protein
VFNWVVRKRYGSSSHIERVEMPVTGVLMECSAGSKQANSGWISSIDTNQFADEPVGYFASTTSQRARYPVSSFYCNYCPPYNIL